MNLWPARPADCHRDLDRTTEVATALPQDQAIRYLQTTAKQGHRKRPSQYKGGPCLEGTTGFCIAVADGENDCGSIRRGKPHPCQDFIHLVSQLEIDNQSFELPPAQQGQRCRNVATYFR